MINLWVFVDLNKFLKYKMWYWREVEFIEIVILCLFGVCFGDNIDI